MKRISVWIVFGVIGLFSLGALFSCGKGSKEENLPVEEVLPLPEEEVLPFSGEEGGLAENESDVRD